MEREAPVPTKDQRVQVYRPEHMSPLEELELTCCFVRGIGEDASFGLVPIMALGDCLRSMSPTPYQIGRKRFRPRTTTFHGPCEPGQHGVK